MLPIRYVTLLLIAVVVCAQDDRLKVAFSRFSQIINTPPKSLLRVMFENGEEANLGNILDISTLGTRIKFETTNNSTGPRTIIAVLSGAASAILECPGGPNLLEMWNTDLNSSIEVHGLGFQNFGKKKISTPMLFLSFTENNSIKSLIDLETEKLFHDCVYLADYLKDIPEIEEGNYFYIKPTLGSS